MHPRGQHALADMFPIDIRIDPREWRVALAIEFLFFWHQNFPMPVPADAVLKMSATGRWQAESAWGFVAGLLLLLLMLLLFMLMYVMFVFADAD